MRNKYKQGQVILYECVYHTIVGVRCREDSRMCTYDYTLNCIRHSDGEIVNINPQPGDGPCLVKVCDTSNITTLIQRWINMSVIST